MNIDKLEENSVWKIILALALPTMIGQLGTILYNMADTYFIGQVNDVNQVAAISVTMPVFLVLMSLGALFGIGSASYISRTLKNFLKEDDRLFTTNVRYKEKNYNDVVRLVYSKEFDLGIVRCQVLY